MSAFIVNETHIDALVTYAVNKRASYWDEINQTRVDITTFNADRIGQILHDENVRSVNYRYAETDKSDEYRWHFYTKPLSAAQVIKACDCLDYQSCETPDWEESTAWRILQEIKSTAMRHIPGYESAEWEISGERSNAVPLTSLL